MRSVTLQAYLEALNPRLVKYFSISPTVVITSPKNVLFITLFFNSLKVIPLVPPIITAEAA